MRNFIYQNSIHLRCLYFFEWEKMESDISLNECFQLQMSEVEMLNSMYPSDDEFIISLPYVLADMNKYLFEESKHLPNQLDFVLNLAVPDIKDKLEVNVCFPHQYPVVKPEICVRSVGLSRSQQRELNSAMTDFLNTLPSGDLYILLLINWLTENASQFFSLNLQTDEHENKTERNCTSDILCRMWIYSHHIYNKIKRREIVDSADELNLTGFSLPGKPGFICVEGFKKDCSEFLQHLKRMSWKKLSLVREEINHSREIGISQFRKFEKIVEISFQVRKGPAREYHMDMGQFLKYLEQHDCAYAFQDLLGLEGQISTEK